MIDTLCGFGSACARSGFLLPYFGFKLCDLGFGSI